MRTDFPALIDEWASRFFEELDYVKEGNNGIRFADFMAKELPQVSTEKSTQFCTADIFQYSHNDSLQVHLPWICLSGDIEACLTG